MEFQAYKREWLDALKAQEETLRMEELTADGAFDLGCAMVRLAREKYRKPIAVRIITGGQTTFSFLMEGTDSHNEWWMDKKLNTCRLSGASSIRTLVEVAEGLRPLEPEYENANNFALCGGCFPLKNAASKCIGYALCSGMAHECDHQLIADALAAHLKREIPSILD